MILNIIKPIIKNKLNLLQSPSFVTYFVTWKCNCKCVMCDIWKKKKLEKELTITEIKKIFSQFKKLDAVRISGGEPFLRKDLAEIINTIHNQCSPDLIHITTNGLLTERIVEVMNKIKPIKKIHLKISIDNIGDAHDKIRGVPGAYKKAIETVRQLSLLRDKLKFYLGVNQTITDQKDIESYKKLKDKLKEYNVNIHAVLAYDSSTSLYSDNKTLPSNSIKLFGDFDMLKLKDFLESLNKEALYLNDFKEKLIKLYYLKGLYNRLFENKDYPNPKCVALFNHLRLLPNGDVPVCMYNSEIIGNLRTQSLKDIWFGDNIKKHRLWVRNCKGCWAGCECNISGIYTGDLWKGII